MTTITIEIPQLTCSRCSVSTPVAVHQLVKVQPGTKTPAGLLATDSEGGTWRAAMSERPADWTVVANQQLCAACSKGLEKATSQFLKPPELPPPPRKPVESFRAPAAPTPRIQTTVPVKQTEIGKNVTIVAAPHVNSKVTQNRPLPAPLKRRRSIVVSKPVAVPVASPRKAFVDSNKAMPQKVTVTKTAQVQPPPTISTIPIPPAPKEHKPERVLPIVGTTLETK